MNPTIPNNRTIELIKLIKELGAELEKIVQLEQMPATIHFGGVELPRDSVIQMLKQKVCNRAGEIGNKTKLWNKG